MKTKPFAELAQPCEEDVNLVLPKCIDDGMVIVDEITVFVIQPGDAGGPFLRPHEPVLLHRVAPIRPEKRLHATPLVEHKSIGA